MTRIVIRELIWDAWNTEHIKKHNVSYEEIIASIRNAVYHRRAHSGRYLSVGRAGKRIITVINGDYTKAKINHLLFSNRAGCKQERKERFI